MVWLMWIRLLTGKTYYEDSLLPMLRAWDETPALDSPSNCALIANINSKRSFEHFKKVRLLEGYC